MNDPPGGAPLPTAPPWAWIVVVLLVLLWWLWPLLQQLVASFGDRSSNVEHKAPRPQAQPENVADQTHLVGTSAASDANVESLHSSHFIDVGKVEFDLLSEYAKTFKEAASSIGEALYGEPQSPEYAAGAAALHRTLDILDRIFKALDSETELAKVTRLREGADSFQKTFGDHRVGNAARKLLSAAGFERTPDGFWMFNVEHLKIRFQGMCVRLCLQKHVELQKQRGRQVWTQTTNMDVVPKLDGTCLSELLWLYHSDSKIEVGYSPSLKEKGAESTTSMKICTFRSEVGCNVPLALHDGLTSVARKIANVRRTSSRSNNGERLGISVTCVDAETQSLLGMLALPPGCIVGKLEYVTTDLPHVFGMTSTSGVSNDNGDADKAAEILANEAVRTWTTKEAGVIRWASAAIFGVGVSLDYTINRGFFVVLLAGFEGLEPIEQLGTVEKKENKDLMERLAAAPKRKGLAFGAQVHDLSSLHDAPDARRRRGPPKPPGGGGG